MSDFINKLDNLSLKKIYFKSVRIESKLYCIASKKCRIVTVEYIGPNGHDAQLTLGNFKNNILPVSTN